MTDASYKAMTALHKKHAAQGLRILAFPCNQFGKQEPHDEATIEGFVKQYDVEFTMFGKIDVNGPNTHPIYEFLKKSYPGDLTWNFSAVWLVDEHGVPHARFNKTPWADISAAVDEIMSKL